MPDTYAYFIAGYIVIFGILGAYITWLAVKAGKIERRMKEHDEE